MAQNQKLRGEERREAILQQLRSSGRPMTGSELAERANVSRQVIVQDIALLKARDEPIIATPQGYVLQTERASDSAVRKVIACCHDMDQTEEELNILVDHGIKVIDVIVEHPFYGEIHGSLMLQSRVDVKRFMEKIEETNASLLSSLTGGVHLHTVEAPSQEYLDKACAALAKADILLKME